MTALLDLRIWLALALAGALLWGFDARTDLANLRATNAESGQHAEKAERAKERTWNDRVQEAAANAQDQTNALAPAVADGRAAADRMPTAARTVVSRACPRPAAADAGTSEPREDPLDLLAGVLHRHSVELVEVGEFADRLRIAGLACERAYLSLSPP